MTPPLATCGAWGDARPIGELDAYMDAPGVVLRCRTCQAVQVRLVRGPGRAWLDLRGVRVVEVALPAPG
jgi:hypothetical protein